MKNYTNKYISNLRHDIPASIIVFLVAMPLCLGIAMASGAPLFSGIISGIVGGIVVSIISGSELGVSGPAAGLTAIVISALATLGSFETFLLAVVIAGILQVILGLMKAGVIAHYFPTSVIKGMLSGIGITIMLKQIPHAVGYDATPAGDYTFGQANGHNTFTDLAYMLEGISPTAMIISLISIAILILWERPFMQKFAITKHVQGPLVVVILGIVMNRIFSGISGYELNNSQMVNLPVPNSFNEFIGQFSTPNFSQIMNNDVWTIAITLAIVASIESLLSVEATDKLDPQKRVTNTNRELIAQGVGNIVSGSIGGLPVTQVIVRSSANIQSGGKTRASAFFHGVLLLLSALFIPQSLNMIPLSSLAAILIIIGFKLAKPELFKQMFKLGKSQFFPFVITIIGILLTDLLSGIAMGMVVAVFHILWNNMKTPYQFISNKNDKKSHTFILAEHVSFLNRANIQQTLNSVTQDSSIVIDMRRTRYIHPDISEIIEDFIEHAKSLNISVEVLGEQRTEVRDEFKIFKQTIKN